MEDARCEPESAGTLVAAIGAASMESGAASDAPKGTAGLILTLGRVRSLIKEDPEIKSISNEACFAIARSTELLLGSLLTRAAGQAPAGEPSTVSYDELAAAVASWPPVDFLKDIIPQRLTASEIVARMKATALEVEKRPDGVKAELPSQIAT